MGLHLWGWPPCDSEWGGRWSQRQGPGCDPLGLESVILFRSWLSPQCLWHWRLQAAPPDGHLTLCRKQKSLFSPANGIFSLFGASFLCSLHLSQDGQAPVGDLTPPQHILRVIVVPGVHPVTAWACGVGALFCGTGGGAAGDLSAR